MIAQRLGSTRHRALTCFLLPLFAAASLHADPVPWAGNGHWYEVCVVPDVSWGVARDAALARGGYLATISSADENAFIFNLILNTPDSWYVLDGRRAVGPWLGAYQPKGIIEPGVDWTWSSGEPFNWNNWSPGQPDNDDLGESFLHFSNLGTQLDGTWNDRANNDNNRDTGYIVEYNSSPCVTFLSQPTSKYLCPGQDGVFTVRAFSPFPMTFQWLKDGQPLEPSSRIHGAASPRLTIDSITDADEGVYTCLITNNCSPVTTDLARLTVGIPGDLTGSTNPFDPSFGIPNGLVDNDDFAFFITQFEARNFPIADITGASDPTHPSYGAPDGVLDASDQFYFLDLMARGCPPQPIESLDDKPLIPPASGPFAPTSKPLPRPTRSGRKPFPPPRP